MTAVIAGGAAVRSAIEKAVAGGERLPLAEVRLLAPLRPGLILASGGNYMDHRDEKDDAPLAGREPEFFFKTPHTVIGPGDSIELDPRVTKKLDYEVELAVVIGKTGRHVPLASALDHVFGYTILNDATARERQVRFREDGTHFYEAGSSKKFDTSCPMGPYLATRDEIPDPQALKLQTRVNGELRQNNTTASMVFDVAHLIHFFSTYLTLYPGYVIATGTPGGTAWGGDPELGGRPYERNDVVRARGYLADGDEVCCSVEGLGELRNTVAAVKI
jgi:2-keto-4-pentenoate hydratase/2-oxohepta-3-ene-1,7-dioic acid hydratase in catechol pathway